jgi:hypothetical protein
MIDDEKGYKKIMDEKYEIYCKKFSDDLNNASRDNPKHFWKILGGRKRKQQPNIEINTLYEFFKDLNTKGPDEQQSTTLQNELPNNSNVHVTGYISQNEIFKCIKYLKNNRFFHTLIWKTGGSSTSDINCMSFHEWSEAERVERHNKISITTGRSGDVPYQPIKVPIFSVNNICFHLHTPMYGFH